MMSIGGDLLFGDYNKGWDATKAAWAAEAASWAAAKAAAWAVEAASWAVAVAAAEAVGAADSDEKAMPAKIVKFGVSLMRTEDEWRMKNRRVV